MAFPGELNINYYKGDTHEFKVYPQKTDGSIFYLNDYSNATFKIAEVRGVTGLAGQKTGSAIISTDGTHIVCAITPEVGAELDSSITYVYDIQVYAPGPGTYDKVFTLLTGSISVTDDVTQGNGSPNVYIAKYTVTYHANGATSGTAPLDSSLYVLNENITLKEKETLARIGYTFDGWTKNSSGTGNVYAPQDTYPIISTDLNFYAKWSANQYLVSYEENGGTTVPGTFYHTDQAISAPVEPTKSGATFVGWCETPEVTEIITFPYTPGGIGNITLYAKWAEA